MVSLNHCGGLAASFHLCDLEMSIVDLGSGVVWVCGPLNAGHHLTGQVDSVAESVASLAAAATGRQVDLKAIEEVRCALLGSAASVNSSTSDLQVITPEACPQLGFCGWDGDGHFNLEMYCDKHPPSICQVVTFVRMIKGATGRHVHTVIHLSSEVKRAQAAVLAGAVLVLTQGLSARAAWAKLIQSTAQPRHGQEAAWDRFPAPFSSSPATSDTSVTVLDCLDALEKARDFGWVNVHTFDPVEWTLLRRRFDASWIIPGKVLALGDPLSTSRNPYCPGLLPVRSSVSLSHKDVDDMCSSESTCDSSTEPEHFGAMLQRHGVGLIIRLNRDRFTICPGSPGGYGEASSQYTQMLNNAGVKMRSYEFADGGVPSDRMLSQFLDDIHSWKTNGGMNQVIAIHCRAGLGRTAVMVGAYVTSQWNFSGSSFHAWTRMCRPGSVQTLAQERFVRQYPIAWQPPKASKMKTSAACFKLPSLTSIFSSRSVALGREEFVAVSAGAAVPFGGADFVTVSI